ncbi:ATP-binding protein [Lactobacillus kefiranofaciens]|uniref:ATP-binding protein n=1 Tax=Lactobacillus kefiranofaciens TaxID=267818 RepID=A0AAX3UHH0_9LACO|nr:ATP-binding protein [Lactobacillus kefiranofaciens]WGO86950.1 ATP-binding protein [Lactobacillus kefiranofaciens]
MNTDLIKSVIYLQRRIIKKRKIIPRDYFFEPNDNYVLVGMRRAGKTTIMHKLARDLVEKGADWNQIIYVNFEDERLNEMKLSDLDTIVAAASEMTDKQPYFFFDEIQNIDGWERFARRLADQGERVYITGSNSKMMSSEIISRLGGRYMMKYVTPYNFTEYLTAKNIQHDEEAMLTTQMRAKIVQGCQSYLENGGLPDSLNQIVPRNYLTNIYQNIFLGDIVTRNSVRNVESLRLLISKIAETVMHEVSYSRLATSVKQTQNPISTQIAIKYINYAKEAYLLFDIKNYASKFAERESTPKFYFLDNGILNLFLFQKDPVLLENMVAITLYNKYKEDMYYLHSAKNKIDLDFYLPSVKTAVQVAWELDDFSKEREIAALTTLAQKDKKIDHFEIITWNQEETIEANEIQIQVKPLYKFLLAAEKHNY